MRKQPGWLGALLLVTSGALVAAKEPPRNDLIVHEWGTFLAMQGADGMALDGMYHEEHALPGFVHARSRDQLQLPSVNLKGETPVVYFYTPVREEVTVRVRFPRGLWTQWYPQASQVGPALESTGSPPALKNGHIAWHAELLPDASAAASLPRTDPKALWNYAREVDAAYVRTRDPLRGQAEETERYLFYRGLGEAPLPVRITTEAGGTLSWTGSPAQSAGRLFVLRVEKGRGAYRSFPELRAGAPRSRVIPGASELQPLPELTRRLSAELASGLTESGLYPREALAMVHTWQHSYFETDGVRVLFILPQAWTEALIPMEIDPRPRRLVRTMVGRLELLTPERQLVVEEAVRRLSVADASRREQAFLTLREAGRYAEPILRCVQRETGDPAVREVCRRLLLSSFVTELRAAVNDPVTGERTGTAEEGSKVFVRAQLASLLREIGRDDEARQEGAAALQQLQRIPEPPFTEPAARHHLRAYARSLEGTGDGPAALAAYERFVRWGSQVKRCGGCHQTEGPRDMSWFRDWWAGKKLAAYAARTGQAADLIARGERALAGNPGDTATQMVLAYLYTARGETGKADRMWSSVTAPSPGTPLRGAASPPREPAVR